MNHTTSFREYLRELRRLNAPIPVSGCATIPSEEALQYQLAPDQEIITPLPEHWTYRAWSRVLDAEVWFVCCEQEVAQLAASSVARGCIYTEAELVELLRLPQRPSAEVLKSLHAVKSYFDATVVPVDMHSTTTPA